MTKQEEPGNLPTTVTHEDLAHAVADSCGMKYSKDGKRLLSAPKELKGRYEVKEGTTVICDSAFSRCEQLVSVDIPDDVTCIDDLAFEYCHSLNEVIIPDTAVTIGRNVFYGCESLNPATKAKIMPRFGNQVF